jgi:uncharacterized protein YcbK (DUF882 family)
MRSRREFLRASGVYLLCNTLVPARADDPQPASASPSLPATNISFPDETARSLAFENLHTREKLHAEYWSNGTYVPDALGAINHVLRDFRTGDVHVIEPKLLDVLSLLHRTLESTKPFQVLSGYRSPATNAMLHAETSGVLVNSLHMYGMAIDIFLTDCQLKAVRDAARALGLGGVGYYPDRFVHVDIGPVHWW